MKKQVLSNKESREFLKKYKKGEGKTWEQYVFELEAKEKAAKRKAKRGETFSVTYTGKVLSMNEMKSDHWRKFKPKYDKVKEELKSLILEKSPPIFTQVELSIFYNGRLDLDNTFATEKPYVDAFVELGFLPDDKKNYIPDIRIKWAKDLPSGTMIFQVKEIGIGLKTIK